MNIQYFAYEKTIEKAAVVTEAWRALDWLVALTVNVNSFVFYNC